MIAVGVDTHKHEHVAKALDGLGQVLGGLQIKANLHATSSCLGGCGHSTMTSWSGSRVPAATVPACVSFCSPEGIAVVEVERPRRQERRRGRSDQIDALAAAKKVLANQGLSTPRAGGTRQALSALLVAYGS